MTDDFVSLKDSLEKTAPDKSLLFDGYQTELDDSWRYNYILSEKYRRIYFDRDNGSHPKTMALVRKYVDNMEENIKEKIGVLITGNVGTGKTFVASMIVNESIRRYKTMSMIANMSQLAKLKIDDPDLYTCFLKCPLVCLDDFGIERDTTYMNETLFDVIDARLNLNKGVTIITTNLQFDTFKNPTNITESRIYSRILELCPWRLLLKGEDQRVKKTARQIELINEYSKETD